MRRADVKTLVLTQLLDEIDRPDIRKRILDEIRREFDGTVICGEGLMEMTLPET